MLLRPKKEKGKFTSTKCVYSFFLNSSTTSRISTTMIKTNSPAIAGIKYWSAIDGGASVGVTVAAGSLT